MTGWRNSPIQKFVCAAVAIAMIVSLIPTPVRAEEDTLEQVGDFMQIAVPVGAFVGTFFAGNPEGGKWDKEGSKQEILTYGSAWLTMMVVKQAASKMRPNGTNRTSYPSGHTTSAFAGAAFLQKRYGKIWGILGYAGAGITAYSRVESQWHFADDVLAGASNSILWAQVFVTPHFSRNKEPGRVDQGMPARWRYNFNFGSAFVVRNEVESPDGVGTMFDLATFSKRDDPTTTAIAELDYYLNDRQTLSFGLAPFESRDNGTFADTVFFAGEVFPPGVNVNSQWRQYNVSGRWTYDLLGSDVWGLNLGGGLLFTGTYVRLATDNDATVADVEDVALLPFLHGDASVRFLRKWTFGVGVEGSNIASDWFLNAQAKVNFDLNPHWDFSVGFLTYNRDIGTDEVRNSAIYEAPFGSIAYRW